MALMRETVRSFRTYLFLAGALGSLSNLRSLVAPQAGLPERAIGLAGLMICATLLYLGATLPSKLRTQIGFVQVVLGVLIGFNVLLLAGSVMAALAGVDSPSVVPVIGVLIGWYLLVNARRLHAELNAPPGQEAMPGRGPG